MCTTTEDSIENCLLIRSLTRGQAVRILWESQNRRCSEFKSFDQVELIKNNFLFFFKDLLKGLKSKSCDVPQNTTVILYYCTYVETTVLHLLLHHHLVPPEQY